MKTETFDSAEAFMDALHGKKRQKRGRNTRPDLPAAGRSPATGLTTLLVAAWSIEYRVGVGYRLYRINGVSTDWCASELAACAAAKRFS
jgi:hypothetical protein